MKWKRDRTGRYVTEGGRFDARRNFAKLRGWIVRDRHKGVEVHTFTLAVAKQWAESRLASESDGKENA